MKFDFHNFTYDELTFIIIAILLSIAIAITVGFGCGWTCAASIDSKMIDTLQNQVNNLKVDLGTYQ